MESAMRATLLKGQSQSLRKGVSRVTMALMGGACSRGPATDCIA